MERLEIGLLGGFELRRDGRVLDPPTLRAARSLFAFLVLNRDRAHTRDLLAGTFWPDFDESRARRRLSQALWQTQRTLGEEEGQRYIVGTADTVRFNPDTDFWLDVDEFSTAIGEAQEPNKEEEALERAVALYRGDLLAGFYDDWLFHDQDRLRTRFLGALERLADLAVARGDYETALVHARRLAQEDEFDEESHRRVMRVAVLLGRHNEAIRQFEECRRILAEELGADPSAETIELYEATLADRDSGGRPIESGEDEFPLFGEGDAAPFVGRESERSVLAERLDEVLEGQGRILLVEGESGVGKTRLLREVAADAQWRGMDVVWGRSTPTGGRPFGPIGDALRSGLSDLRVRQLRNLLDDTRISTLAPLMPRLAPEADPEVALGMADERARMHEAIGTAFQTLAETNPTLVVLEDVHWADEDTISALEQVALRIRDDRLMFAITYRHGEARERSEVWGMLRSLDRLEYCERISLAALTPAQTEDLIRRSLGRQEVSGGFSERLHQDTGGVPLFILETLRAMYEIDSLAEADSPAEDTDPSHDRLPISPTVHALMRQRLQTLEPPARRMLELASAHDGSLGLHELVDASELDEEAALEAVDGLRNRRLLSAAEDRFAVDHELMRRVVYEDLPISRRLDVHRRIATAIVHSRPDEVEHLAHHYLAARMPDQAAPWLVKAADRAMTVHAFDTAATYWAQASRALDDIEAPREQRYGVAARHEEVLGVLGRRPDQELALRRMERLASEADLPDVLRRRAWWLAHQDQVEEAVKTAAQALEKAQQAQDEPGVVRSLTVLGMISCFAGKASEGVSYLEQAADLNQLDAAEEADARNAIGQNLIDLQRFDEAKSHLLAALGLYEESSNPRGQVEVLGTLATMRMETGDADSAESDFVRAIDLADAIGYGHGSAVYRMNLGILYVITNRVGAAVAAFDAAQDAYQALGNRRGKALVLSNSAWLLHGLIGRDDEALRQISEAYGIYEDIGDERGLAQCEGLRGSVFGRQHKLGEAQELFERSLERTRRLGDHWLTAQALREYASTELENDLLEPGLAHVSEAERLCTEFGLNDLLVGVRALKARLLLRIGQREDALEHATRAMRELRKGVEFAHLVPLAMSEVQLAMGDEVAAATAIERSMNQLSAMLNDLEPADRERSWSRVPNHARILQLWSEIASQTTTAELPSTATPLGKAPEPSDLVEVRLTVRHPRDAQIEDRIERRRHQLVRVLDEALAQGASPTVKDLANILGSSNATVRRDMAALRADGHTLNTRGSRS